MLLDLDGNALKIIDDEHMFQLEYWGFQKNDNIYIAKDYDLIAIIDFLNESFQNHTLSTNVQLLYNSNLQEVEQFKKVFDLGKKIKDGNFNKDDYLDHIEFLEENIPNRKLSII